MTLSMIDVLRKFRSTSKPEGYATLPPEDIPVGDNRLTVYMEGDSVYSAMLSSINNAQDFVYFETFIWKNDRVGHLFKDALIRAARRGVSVHIIWDTFGNLVVPPPFFNFPRLRTLHPLRFPLPHTGRDHRKILVVDGKIGFVGGYNIGSLYGSEEWRDTHMRIVGPAVWELERAFVDFWNRARRRRFARLVDNFLKPLVGKPQRLPRLPDLGTRQWEADVRALINDPKRFLFPIRGNYIDTLERATKSAYITSAYFIPDGAIRAALIRAARRGVDVKVLVPEKSNHIVTDWISRAYYPEMLRAGVEIWLYRDVMIHAKTAVVDGEWATIGTANIDRMSMTGNHEINMEVFSYAFAHKVQDVFRTDLLNARQMTLEEWAGRPWIVRMTEKLLQPLDVLF